jgi:hypothetical protein
VLVPAREAEMTTAPDAGSVLVVTVNCAPDLSGITVTLTGTFAAVALLLERLTVTAEATDSFRYNALFTFARWLTRDKQCVHLSRTDHR